MLCDSFLRVSSTHPVSQSVLLHSSSLTWRNVQLRFSQRAWFKRATTFVLCSARSGKSRNFVGAMTAAIIERFADAYGPLRALVVGEEWGQLYASNFYEILTVYRQGGINFLGVFQNVAAQIKTKYGKETARIWKKAVAHTLYRGLTENDTLKEIEHRSGKTSVMVRSFNVNQNQVNGSGDSLSEQSRPLL